MLIKTAGGQDVILQQPSFSLSLSLPYETSKSIYIYQLYHICLPPFTRTTPGNK